MISASVHRTRRLMASLVALAAGVGACSNGSSIPQEPADRPFVIAHRGGRSLPENTMAAFRASLSEGADYLETDLVATKDGVLVLRHERRLAATTDVEDHPEFAGRRATKPSYGRPVSDWFVEDFTAAELSTLRATLRHAAPTGDNRIATLAELLQLAKTRGAGLLLETKEARMFEGLGLDLEDLLAEALRAAGLASSDRVLVQSWGPKSVRDLAVALEVPALRLFSGSKPWDRALTEERLRRLRDAGLGGLNVHRDLLRRDPELIRRAHAAGLLVTGWGLGAGEDYAYWNASGLDGLVTDDVPAAVAAQSEP
jgi:glycerophosphoryl diester phosphodiesterase